MLVVFGGLPGVGKTTIARALAGRLSATYLRVDAIEQAIRAAGVLAAGVGTAGYAVALALAESNLALGRAVVADGVNPVAASRRAWRDVAARAGSGLLEVEIVCSDLGEHRRRVEGRRPDVPGLAPPTWPSVLAHAYEPWDRPRLVLDSARLGVEEAATAVEERVRGLAAPWPRVPPSARRPRGRRPAAGSGGAPGARPG